jgi:hypothetical protein
MPLSLDIDYGSLLPEFITGALFDPLNVPEVWLRLPFTREPESLPIEKALREAVPGLAVSHDGDERDHRVPEYVSHDDSEPAQPLGLG